jgi:CMP/dCMP kinase
LLLTFYFLLLTSMIVTIDGPAGAGKSSAARALARRLGFEYLDTGAMYRAVTLAALRKRIELNDDNSYVPLLAAMHLEMPAGRVILNGEEVTDEIRKAEVTAASGAVADRPVVRRRLVELQRRIAAGRDMICEGRDQGTIVFPEAACKFFLVADAEERARRRQREMAARGEVVSWEELVRAQDARDHRDAARDIAPMVAAPDAIHVDSTDLSLDDMVALMEAQVRKRLADERSNQDQEPGIREDGAAETAPLE